MLLQISWQRVVEEKNLSCSLTFVPIAQQVHHIEPDGLIGPLFQHGRRQTLIRAPHP